MGKKKVRLIDIAEKTGYSVATISHYINKTRNIEESTQDTIAKAIKELGYVLPSQRTYGTRFPTIGLIIADIRVDFYSEIVRYIEDAAYENNYNILIMDSEENSDKEIFSIKSMIASKIAGIILAPCNTNTDFDFCKSFPIVQIDRMTDKDYFDFVGIDNLSVTHELTKRLISENHKNIGFISFSDINYCSRERRKGYTLALMEADLFQKENILAVNYDADISSSGIDSFLATHKDLTALICSSSNICYGALNKIGRMGDQCKISKICTFDDNKWLDFVNIPIDSVQQPISVIGKTAVDLLISKIKQEKIVTTTKKVMLESSIITRQ
jgi:LacI family transcriptional regulator